MKKEYKLTVLLIPFAILLPYFTEVRNAIIIIAMTANINAIFKIDKVTFA